MSESHETNDSLDVTPATAVQSEEPDSTAPGFDVPADLPASERNGESPAAETPVVRPLSEAMLDQDSDLVVGSDDDTVEIADSPLMPLAPLLLRPDPLTWVFAGARLAGDSAHDDGRLAGEWFAEEWRAETGRATDVVIDATWPGCPLATLKGHLKSRVVRPRPDVAVLFLDRSEAGQGVDGLPQFERRLLAVLSVLAEIGAVAVLVQPPLDDRLADIDQEIYFEAIAGIARERGLPHLVLPESNSVPGSRMPDSRARASGLFLCREAMRAWPE